MKLAAFINRGWSCSDDSMGPIGPLSSAYHVPPPLMVLRFNVGSTICELGSGDSLAGPTGASILVMLPHVGEFF